MRYVSGGNVACRRRRVKVTEAQESDSPGSLPRGGFTA